ncbi:tetratricopeptide repeat protein [Methanosarcina sp. KYL-1]|nr:tetratricopeptide repeat protein [Methanosarcina sp. KYL-1]
MEDNPTDKISRYRAELLERCRAALSAFNALNRAKSPAAFRLCLQKFLGEFEGISTVLWSRSNRKNRKELRSVLYITDDSPFNPSTFGPGFASGLEKVLKEEAKDGEEDPDRSKTSEPAPSALAYSPCSKVLTVNGKQYEVLPLFLAVRNLYATLPLYGELKSCTERLEKDPEDATALFQKAVLLYKATRHEDALQLTESLLGIAPEDYRVWYNRGVILSEMGRLEDALEAYDRTIELDPSFQVAGDNKGVVLAKLGRYEEALETYEKTLRKNPKYAEAWAGKGSVLSALDRKEEALEAYNSALEIRPEYLEALACKGSLLSRLGSFEAALEAYDLSLRLAPAEPGLWHSRGLVLSELQKYEEALQSCNRALELSPGFAPALECKVRVLSEISRKKTQVRK